MKDKVNKAGKREENSLIKQVRMFGPALIALLGIIVILQNTGPVETRILFFTIKMPQAIFILGIALVGFALGVIVAFSFTRKKR